MNRLIILVTITLCTSCAHTSSAPETDQLVANILDSSGQQMCAKDQISTCRVTTRTPAAQTRKRCECVPVNAFDATAPGARDR